MPPKKPVEDTEAERGAAPADPPSTPTKKRKLVGVRCMVMAENIIGVIVNPGDVIYLAPDPAPVLAQAAGIGGEVPPEPSPSPQIWREGENVFATAAELERYLIVWPFNFEPVYEGG